MSKFQELQQTLSARPLRWVVTGAAGFIGSHLVESLLRLNQQVIALDNFATGFRENLADIRAKLGPELWGNLEFIEGDILHQSLCRKAFEGADYVLHQAALGSVPRSVKDPWTSNQVNVDGFISVLLAAREAGVKRTIFASSSSVYGDSPTLPKREDVIGEPLSPYAATKRINEMYAAIFRRHYGMQMVALRYFNVFGPRQNPNGPYAAVIPRWIEERLSGKECTIYGDGTTSRDFCYVANVVQANLLAAITEGADGLAFNIAVGEQTSLNDLYTIIDESVSPPGARRPVVHQDFRPGDVKHSLADITRARTILGYDPTIRAREGLALVVDWYKAKSATVQAPGVEA